MDIEEIRIQMVRSPYMGIAGTHTDRYRDLHIWACGRQKPNPDISGWLSIYGTEWTHDDISGVV